LLYWLFYQYQQWLNIMRYPTFRAIIAGLTALLAGLLLYPSFIAWLRRRQQGASNVREDTPETHQAKAGTPTMGGLLWLAVVAISTLLWGDLTQPKNWLLLGITMAFGGIGFVDDWRKLVRRNSKGLSARLRLVLQFAFSLAFMGLLIFVLGFDTRVSFPVINFERFNPDVGPYFYLLFAAVVIVGTANAVNMTDGLDGLAIGPVITSAFTFLVLSYAAGAVLWGNYLAEYLRIPHIEGAEELTVFCASMMGAGISFLWYNTYPASVFMGDVGSLSMGAALGTLAVLTKNEIVSAIIHGVFLMEILSVMIQVVSFQTTGKRVFRMAPLHHHFELKGWKEPKIIVRFWIVSIMLALLGLASLKIR